MSSRSQTILYGVFMAYIRRPRRRNFVARPSPSLAIDPVTGRLFLQQGFSLSARLGRSLTKEFRVKKQNRALVELGVALVGTALTYRVIVGWNNSVANQMNQKYAHLRAIHSP